MGGFKLVRATDEVLLDDETFCRALRMRRYAGANLPPRFGKTSEIAFPTITAAEIKDKGRGDFLSKAIAILQTTWFIAQCIARGVEGIALTELELVTLALATLNGLMYYFWWDKPLGVKEPVRVYTVDVDPPKKVVDGKERLVNMTLSTANCTKCSCVTCSNSTRLLWKLHPIFFRHSFLLLYDCVHSPNS